MVVLPVNIVWITINVFLMKAVKDAKEKNDYPDIEEVKRTHFIK